MNKNNIRKFGFFTATFLSLCICRKVHAQSSITLSSLPSASPQFLDASGSPLALNSYVRVGVFDVSGGHLLQLQTSNDLSVVENLFTPLAEGISGAGTVTQSIGGVASGLNHLVVNNFSGTGTIFGRIGGISTAYLSPGRDLYVWVFNSPDYHSASQWGIYSATSGWKSPNNLGTETLSTTEINNVIRGNAIAGGYQLAAVAVPEPSATALLLGGTILMGFRRSRRPEASGRSSLPHHSREP